MPRLMITLDQIRENAFWLKGWKNLLRAKADLTYDTPFPVSDILESNGFKNTVWTFNFFPSHEKLWAQYALWCAQQVAHLSDDSRVRDCLEVAENKLTSSGKTKTNVKIAEAIVAAHMKASAEYGLAVTYPDLADNLQKTAAAVAAASSALAAFWAVCGGPHAVYLSLRRAPIAAYMAAREALSLNPQDIRTKLETKLRQILDSGEWV